MRSGVLTASSFRERGELRATLALAGAVLALALVAVGVGLSDPAAAHVSPGQGQGRCSRVAWGAGASVAAPAQHRCMQPRSAALHEQDAIAVTASSTFLPHQVLAARGRAKFQPHPQSVIRLIRERQDAIITAFSHRLRDASEPGAASHSADRPLIVTRPLRGPPSRV